jgi:hypothetical protein
MALRVQLRIRVRGEGQEGQKGGKRTEGGRREMKVT